MEKREKKTTRRGINSKKNTTKEKHMARGLVRLSQRIREAITFGEMAARVSFILRGAHKKRTTSTKKKKQKKNALMAEEEAENPLRGLIQSSRILIDFGAATGRRETNKKSNGEKKTRDEKSSGRGQGAPRTGHERKERERTKGGRARERERM